MKNITFLLTLFIFVSCSTARMNISAKKAEFPVSLTECFYDQNYNLVTRENYEVMYHFKTRYHKVTLMSKGKIKLIDISPELIQLVKSNNADAVVNVKIKIKNSGLSEYFVNPISLMLTFGILVPAHLVAVVEGDIVKMK